MSLDTFSRKNSIFMIQITPHFELVGMQYVISQGLIWQLVLGHWNLIQVIIGRASHLVI